ncbi:MAG: phage antirepressor KilAC domain-containing protein [Intestinimonas massiliensis]|uniref:phage antirepressor KilAC domain-containing protein n=1 Tax=Intestinimonas massiliensis (ex Afouda et al. 2020) TaxID=1673721 RepID=UPI00242D95A7|nr:phage antirepressor KilAC domain-containing protein [Intestinimonas massiliensis (ex Afouda et al. 2020)]
MNELQIFNNDRFEVRATMKDGEPLFVAADVCKALDIQNHIDALKRLDEDEKSGVDLTDPHGRIQTTNCVTESGLYTLVLGSRKPEAKQFKRWITHEVIPSIRKTGGYIAGQSQMTDSELMAAALLLANRQIKERDARISALSVQNAIMAPKADYFDELVERNTLTNFRETAKELGVPPKKFVEFLLVRKYLYRDKKGKLLPYEDKNNGLFEVKEAMNDKTKWSGTQTFVTPKGRETFRLLYV